MDEQSARCRVICVLQRYRDVQGRTTTSLGLGRQHPLRLALARVLLTRLFIPPPCRKHEHACSAGNSKYESCVFLSCGPGQAAFVYVFTLLTN